MDFNFLSISNFCFTGDHYYLVTGKDQTFILNRGDRLAEVAIRVYVLCFMFYVLCFIFYVLCFMFYVYQECSPEEVSELDFIIHFTGRTQTSYVADDEVIILTTYLRCDMPDYFLQLMIASDVYHVF